MKSLTINDEPYVFFRINKPMIVFTRINRTRYSIAQKGDYVLIDRWFNLMVANEKQMSLLVRADYANFKRTKNVKTK